MREPHTFDPVTKRMNVDSMFVRVEPHDDELWCIEWGYSATRQTMANVGSASYSSLLWGPEDEAHAIAQRKWLELLLRYQLADEEADRALRESADLNPCQCIIATRSAGLEPRRVGSDYHFAHCRIAREKAEIA